MADATRRLQTEFNQARRQAITQERDAAIAAARQRAQGIIEGYEARRGGRGGAAPATPQGNTTQATPPARDVPATQEGSQPPVAQLRLQQAREAIARGAPRAQVEQMLRQQGIDPRAL